MSLKNLLLSACCLLAAFSSEAKKVGNLRVGGAVKSFTPAEEEFMNRRRAVKRERITIGTNEYWVVTYMKGAKPDGVTTNLAYSIEGVPQTNPMEEDAGKAVRIRKAKKNAAKKDAKNLEKLIEDAKKSRDKSSEAMREVYDAVLAILEENVGGN